MLKYIQDVNEHEASRSIMSYKIREFSIEREDLYVDILIYIIVIKIRHPPYLIIIIQVSSPRNRVKKDRATRSYQEYKYCNIARKVKLRDDVS